MSDTVLNAFPEDNIEGLALIWVKQNADKATTPQELCRMYWKAYYQIALINRDTAREIKDKLKA